jgi:hypothetical protein
VSARRRLLCRFNQHASDVRHRILRVATENFVRLSLLRPVETQVVNTAHTVPLRPNVHVPPCADKSMTVLIVEMMRMDKRKLLAG